MRGDVTPAGGASPPSSEGGDGSARGPGDGPRLRGSRGALLGLAAVAVMAGAGWLDYHAGPGASPVPYLLVVTGAAWWVGRGTGLALAVLGGATWVVAMLSPDSAIATGPLIFDLVSRVAVLATCAYFVDRARGAQDRLRVVNAQLEAALEREASLARTDPVTGLVNRRGFVEHLEREIARTARTGEPFALAYVDLDRFKDLNDRDGHARGDECLRAAAAALVGSIRRTDVVARIGGDELAIVMPGAGPEEALHVAERSHGALAEALGAFDSPGLGASVGVVSFAAAPGSVEDVLRRADETMYRAKRERRGSVVPEAPVS